MPVISSVPAPRLFISVSAFLLTIWAGACGGSSPSPSATPGSDEAAGLIGGRAVFYGAQPGDAAEAIIAGDFNGDGANDIVFGAPLADGPGDARPEGGEVYFFPGPFRVGDERDVASGEQRLTIYGANAGDYLGSSIAAGDVNGDAVDDIVLGAPAGDGPAEDRQDAGEVRVVFGSAALGVDVHELDLARDDGDAAIYGADGNDRAGYAVLAEDVSGDGTDDVIIGALWADGPAEDRPEGGEVYVMFGSTAVAGIRDMKSQAPDVVTYGGAAGDRLGEEVSAGDINGDDRQDLVLPATFATGLRDQTAAAGQTYVILAPPGPQIDVAGVQQDLTVYGVDAGDQFGHSLGTGDVNGDGFADILLAAVSSSGSGNQARLAGEAALVLGRELATGNDPPTVDLAGNGAATVIYGAGHDDRLGRSAAVGDVNGDGMADLLVAAPGGDGENASRNNAGEIYIILGSSSLPGVIELSRGGADALILGQDIDDTLGSEVSGRPALLVEDVDDDGRGDVLAGAPRGDGPDGARTDAGEGYIFFAKAAR
jgi:hypothetical protein